MDKIKKTIQDHKRDDGNGSLKRGLYKLFLKERKWMLAWVSKEVFEED